MTDVNCDLDCILFQLNQQLSGGIVEVLYLKTNYSININNNNLILTIICCIIIIIIVIIILFIYLLLFLKAKHILNL